MKGFTIYIVAFILNKYFVYVLFYVGTLRLTCIVEDITANVMARHLTFNSPILQGFFYSLRYVAIVSRGV